MTAQKLNIVFHSKYLQYDFGPDHPWWATRALPFLEKLKRSKISHQLLTPKKAKDRDILLVHSQEYLDRVKRLAEQNQLLSPDTPLNLKILEAAYYSVGGSILAVEKAMKGEWSINLLGGLHHAGISESSGFCIFNDHAIAVRKLQKQRKIKKAIIYDLDVHAGQGTQEIFYNDPTVFTISIHQDPHTIYPYTGFADQRGAGAGEGYNKNVILFPHSGEEEYLKALDSVLPLADKFSPDLVVAVLGVDTFEEDPLASINLKLGTYYKIGQRLARFSSLAIMFAGGYSPKVPNLWLSFIRGLTNK